MVKNYTSFSDATATYCIAEIGINHNGSLSQAIELVKAAKRAGADAAKFQTYVTEKRAPKNNQEIFDIFKKKYKCLVGYSDHTKDDLAVLTAVANGAKIIEKHFYLHDQHECIDEPVSITEEDFLQMITKIRLMEKIISKPEFGIKDAEKAAVQFKRTS